MLSILCKGAGLLMILGCCAAAGYAYAGKLSGKVREAELLIRYWEAFRMLLRHGRGEPAEILAVLGKGAEFGRLPFAESMAAHAARQRDFARILHSALEEETSLTTGMREALVPLAEAIGRSDLENQLRVLDGALLLLTREKQVSEEKAKRRGGLSRRLGVLGGLLAVVILL